MPESAQGEVKSSVRTLQILKLLSSYQNGLTFTEIQKYLEIPKSSLFVLLSTIIGFLKDNANEIIPVNLS